MKSEGVDKVVLSLTAEEIIKDAIRFFEMTLNGLGKADDFRVEVIEHYALSEDSYVTVRIPGLIIPEHLGDISDEKFDDKMAAAKALALCSVGYVVHYADNELLTRPDEQGWMHQTMAYWHELKDDAFIYKNKHLIPTSPHV